MITNMDIFKVGILVFIATFIVLQSYTTSQELNILESQNNILGSKLNIITDGLVTIKTLDIVSCGGGQYQVELFVGGEGKTYCVDGFSFLQVNYTK